MLKTKLNTTIAVTALAVAAFEAMAAGAGWYVEAKNMGAVSGQLTVQAICAAVS